jgi:hypothetical protein
VRQIILEVQASTLGSIGQALHGACPDANHSIEVLDADGWEDLIYRRTDLTLAEVLERMGRGEIVSLRAAPREGPISLLLVFAPGFGEESTAMWVLSVELATENYRALFDRLRSVGGVAFVAVTAEETLDIDGASVTSETFPWSSPRLILAAVADRTGRGQQVVRAGRAYLPSGS